MVQERLAQFEQVATSPAAQLAAVVESGKKAVGCIPYYSPEELVYAAGMVPFGVWGSESVEIREAKRYFPAFICSLLQTTLEMGLRGDLDALSAMLVPALCDSLKCMTQNWKAGVPGVEMIPVFHPQNRRLPAAMDFYVSQLEGIKARLEDISGNVVTDEAVTRAIAVYNESRALLRRFVLAAARQPALVGPAARSAVIKSARFMDRADHTALLRPLVEELEALPAAEWKGKRVVTTGILADSPELLRILADNQLVVVADDVAAESRTFRTDVPEDASPLRRLALQIRDIEGCTLLYDPEKKRGGRILDLVRQQKADGILVVMTKFCDPDEFDYAILKKQFEAAGVPHLLVEVDQQMVNYGQAETAIEAFCDLL